MSITSSALDMDRVRNVFNELVQRHGVLRTTFSWSNEGKLKQTVHSFMDFDITVVDFSHEANPTRKARKLALVASEEPIFKLDRLPLFTVSVVKLGNNMWNLSLVFHDMYVSFCAFFLVSKTKSSLNHSIMDDASFGIVLNEFLLLYHNRFDSLSPQLVQFSDFSDWLSHTSDRRVGSREGQRKFWKENLKDIQPHNFGLSSMCSTALSDIAQVDVKSTLPSYPSILTSWLDQGPQLLSDFSLHFLSYCTDFLSKPLLLWELLLASAAFPDCPTS